MTEQQTQAWQAMTAKQRMTYPRQGNVLQTTSSQRQAAVAQLKRKAGGG